jgi:hypothetical protein
LFSFVFPRKDGKPNDINGPIVKSDRLLAGAEGEPGGVIDMPCMRQPWAGGGASYGGEVRRFAAARRQCCADRS